jgi:IS30 family transposase
MHKNTKLTEVMRREVYKRWLKDKLSLRMLGDLYHVDKKVISRILERGKQGDFSVHTSVNDRFKKKRKKSKPKKV